MEALKCSVIVVAGAISGEVMPEYTRRWDFTKSDLENFPKYLDATGAAMNYCFHLQRTSILNWVKFEWIWF